MIPLRDDDRCKRIDIPSKNLKQTYSYNNDDFANPQKKAVKDD